MFIIVLAAVSAKQTTCSIGPTQVCW